MKLPAVRLTRVGRRWSSGVEKTGCDQSRKFWWKVGQRLEKLVPKYINKDNLWALLTTERVNRKNQYREGRERECKREREEVEEKKRNNTTEKRKTHPN